MLTAPSIGSARARQRDTARPDLGKTTDNATRRHARSPRHLLLSSRHFPEPRPRLEPSKVSSRNSTERTGRIGCRVYRAFGTVDEAVLFNNDRPATRSTLSCCGCPARQVRQYDRRYYDEHRSDHAFIGAGNTGTAPSAVRPTTATPRIRSTMRPRTRRRCAITSRSSTGCVTEMGRLVHPRQSPMTALLFLLLNEPRLPHRLDDEDNDRLEITIRDRRGEIVSAARA